MKTCSKCKVEKNETEYYKCKGSSDGIQGYCKECQNVLNLGAYYNNKAKCNKDNATQKKNRYQANPQFRARERVRSLFRHGIVLEFFAPKVEEIVGCDYNTFRAYITSKFTPEMSWENYGQWHLDHIIPRSAFDFLDPEQVKQAMHYTNCQPLMAVDNIKKSNKISA